MAQKLKFVVFMGSTREGRLGERVLKFVKNSLQERYNLTIIDPLETEYPMLTKPLHFYKNQSEAPDFLVKANQTVKDADGFIIISCEYNHSIPPALSNMLDHFPGSSFAWRPSGLVTYSPGLYGGVRCAMQLRAMTGEIGCLSVSNIFSIPEVHKSLSETGETQNSHMASGLEKMIKQLDWMAWAMKNMRDQNGIPK